MLLPEHCSAKVDGQGCLLPPSFVISVKSEEGEFMIAVVCDDHKNGIESRLIAMQKENKAPPGKIQFQPIMTVVTDCITGANEDYVEIELKRDVESNRKIR